MTGVERLVSPDHILSRLTREDPALLKILRGLQERPVVLFVREVGLKIGDGD